MEAAIAWGVSWDRWKKIDAVSKAEMLAHVWMQGRVQDYTRVVMKKVAAVKKPGEGAEPDWAKYKQPFPG